MFSEEGTTQGDPLAMAMYAFAVLLLIHRLREHSSTKQIWYADDASARGQINELRNWWNHLLSIGPEYGYHPNALKTWLIVKEGHYENALSIFKQTNVNITKEGQRQLGGAIGTRSFVEQYVKNKVTQWVKEIEKLSTIASTQPQATCASFTHGVVSKWNFLARVIPDISDLIQPLEEAIHHIFLPSLTGRQAFSDDERNIIALPVRLGGLGIPNPMDQSMFQNHTSTTISAPLVELIIQQSPNSSQDIPKLQHKVKKEARNIRYKKEQQSAADLAAKIPSHLQRALNASSEKGASSWLSTLPIEEHGFALHKGAFRDALCLRYGWRPQNLPANCICGKLSPSIMP